MRWLRLPFDLLGLLWFAVSHDGSHDHSGSW